MDIFYLNGERQGQSNPLVPPGICIGREVDNDLQLLINGVSRYHAKLSFDGNDWYLEDLGSTNGTYVCGKKISEKVKLSPGDIFTIGDQELRFGTAPDQSVSEKIQVVSIETKTETAITPEEVQTDLASQIRKSRYSIFSGNPNPEKQKQNKGKKSRLGNLIFTLIVITLPLVCISGYMLIEENKKQKELNSRVEPQKQPFFLYYEKEFVTPDNVFRFEAKVSDDTLVLTVDELRYGRHFVVKKVRLDEKAEKGAKKAVEGSLKEEDIKRLKESIRQTGFMKIQNKEAHTPEGPERSSRKLIIALDGEFNSVSVHNTEATISFEEVEEAVSDLARRYNMQTGSLNAEEMRAEAEECFSKAEELFANHQAASKNIREAIALYESAKGYYEQFEPKPRQWDICRKQLEKAKEVYKSKYEQLRFNIQKYYKMNRPGEASQECGRMLELLDPESKDYQKYRNYKIEFDKKAKKMKKK